MLPERARRIEQRDVAQIPAPPVIMVGGIMMDRLVDAAMHRAVGLLVTGQAHRADSHHIGHRPLADRTRFILAAKGTDFAEENGENVRFPPRDCITAMMDMARFDTAQTPGVAAATRTDMTT